MNEMDSKAYWCNVVLFKSCLKKQELLPFVHMFTCFIAQLESAMIIKLSWSLENKDLVSSIIYFMPTQAS